MSLHIRPRNLKPLSGSDAKLALDALSRAEQQLPVDVVSELLSGGRYTRHFRSYCNLKRDELYEFAAMDLVSLGAKVERRGHSLPAEFWDSLMGMGRHFDIEERLVELRQRGGYRSD